VASAAPAAPAPPPAGPATLAPWYQRHPGAILGGVAVLLLLLVGTVVLVTLLRPGPGTPPEKTQPDALQALLERGRRAMHARDYDRAIEAFRAAQDMSAADAGIRNQAAEAQAAKNAEVAERIKKEAEGPTKKAPDPGEAKAPPGQDGKASDKPPPKSDKEK